MDFRSFLYRLARLLGDINAVGKARVGQRIFNKLLGRGLVSKVWARGCGCLVPALLRALVVITLAGAAFLPGCAKGEYHEADYPTVHDLQVQASESRKQAERYQRITKELEARTAQIHYETQLLKLRIGMTKSEVEQTCGPPDDIQRFEDIGNVDVCGTQFENVEGYQEIWYYGDFRTGHVQVVFEHWPQFKPFYTEEEVPPGLPHPTATRQSSTCKAVPVKVKAINRY